MKTGVELIAEERKRQIEKEGWTAEHDATNDLQPTGLQAGGAVGSATRALQNPARATWPEGGHRRIS